MNFLHILHICARRRIHVLQSISSVTNYPVSSDINLFYSSIPQLLRTHLFHMIFQSWKNLPQILCQNTDKNQLSSSVSWGFSHLVGNESAKLWSKLQFEKKEIFENLVTKFVSFLNLKNLKLKNPCKKGQLRQKI